MYAPVEVLSAIEEALKTGRKLKSRIIRWRNRMSEVGYLVVKD